MPHRTLALTFALLFALAPATALAHAGPAPADEYFGPFKESILEIKNRLGGFERDSDLVLRRSLRGIDTLEVTIEDWYRKYPGDPWIHGFAGRLMRVYARAHDNRGVRYAHTRRMAVGRGF
jgi:hypothetical protein